MKIINATTLQDKQGIYENVDPRVVRYIKQLQIEYKEADEYIAYWQKQVDIKSELIEDLYKELYSTNQLVRGYVDRHLSLQTLKRQLEIKDKWNQLLIDIGVDYDGYNDAENLKELIDELVECSKRAIKNDDKVVASYNSEKQYNILGEEIEC